MKPPWWRWRARREWRNARTLARAKRRRAVLAHYKAGDPRAWQRDRGVALVEAALVLPLIALLLAGGLGLGLAMVADVRLSHAAAQAAEGAAAGILEEDDAAALVESAGGAMSCFWTGTGAGGCYDDGLDVDRHQVVAETVVVVPFIGEVRPTARASALGGGGS